MPESAQKGEQAIREKAYFIWEREGRPEGRAEDHWRHAATEGFESELSRDDEPMENEEKVLAGRADANNPRIVDKGRTWRMTEMQPSVPIKRRTI